MRVLSSEDVAELVDIEDVIGSVEDAYRQLGRGDATDVPRENVRSSAVDGNLKSMAAVGTDEMGGCFYTGGFSTRGEDVLSKLVVVFDTEVGGLNCVVEHDRLSWLRTGATSGVATDHCARPDASSLALIGSGRQARSQLLAVSAVRDITDVAVYSPTRSHREAFREEMSDVVDATIRTADSARSAVAGADVVCTATTAEEPVLDGRWLDPGTHLNAIGAHYPDQREVDTETVRRSTVIVDSLDRARKEEGELIIPADDGVFDWSDATELGDIVSGSVSGRTGADEITYMTSGGLSIEILVAAAAVYDRSVEESVGTTVEFPPLPDLV